MAGISDKALKRQYAENKYQFQKQELQNKEFSDGSGLDWYEFKYRMDDPQIGRFTSVDPLADKYPHNSTYAFSEDKVTSHVELEGLESADFNIERDLNDVETGKATPADLENRFRVRAVISLVSWKIGIKAAEGAVMVVQPEIGIPLVLSDLSGVPVLPAPQAMSGALLEAGLTGLEEGASSMNAEPQILTELPQTTESSTPIADAFSLRTSPEAEMSSLDVTTSTHAPTEAYNRTKHYGRTPTAADRNALGATSGTDVDHNTPLVQHYYEGDGQGGMPGFLMTPAERKAFANNRSNMSVKSQGTNRSDGGKLTQYSKNQKKKFGL